MSQGWGFNSSQQHLPPTGFTLIVISQARTVLHQYAKSFIGQIWESQWCVICDHLITNSEWHPNLKWTSRYHQYYYHRSICRFPSCLEKGVTPNSLVTDFSNPWGWISGCHQQFRLVPINCQHFWYQKTFSSTSQSCKPCCQPHQWLTSLKWMELSLLFQSPHRKLNQHFSWGNTCCLPTGNVKATCCDHILSMFLSPSPC